MLNLPILPVRQDQEDGLAEAIENGERPEAKQEGVLSQRRLALIIFPRRFSQRPAVWISGTIPTLLHQNIIMMTMTPSSETLCSAGGQVKEQINRAHEKAIGNIGLQRNGRCLRSTDGVSDISATLAGIPVQRTASSSLDRMLL